MTPQRILLGVTGGIAAYKSAELLRLLKKAGHEVRVVMTEGAMAFVQPMTFQALSGEPVRTSLLDPEAEAGMGHIELARWAERILVAPASANFLARLAHGMADDLLTTVCCATDAPIVLAPAMNQAMWRNPRTLRNVAVLDDDAQITRLGPDDGDQACGDTGPGRMLEPEQILLRLVADQPVDGPLGGRHVVITAGPTREALDPVRYLTNHSSGKMGYSLADAARQAGARVTLISGPVQLACPAGVARIDVTTAEEMLSATSRAVDEGCDLFVATAAVADYRPAEVAGDKIKKTDGTVSLSMVPNPDILATIAARTDRPFTVGFAAETRDVAAYARDKMARKKLDMIVANDVSQSGLGFNSDQNAVTVFSGEGEARFGPSDKRALAVDLLDYISHTMNA
ncbi:phosphopantothenoylcysteine decarboxylase/phosphopantothenate--cysteine ligase [Tamilnaduibacter salinus]|uniref:Coenzyme A biosynthesis bifunctional protein CoaBC n=1 Tax=Tamilnaduibacter salinus TaxID=1484056 RepID=A0A2U1CWL9_9GAMM|nr:bifunctional phosphopantothenoylcysteine decarboxylase/phosphopantothenate--cysteine ligase CoaBC [Tamilnaduibacter salinus]PVY76380.1 phosphopantothenoylcysteine decarboxylase/phosphopantothenate--cysteine ligase [Tamilnaduibacter salinus]